MKNFISRFLLGSTFLLYSSIYPLNSSREYLKLNLDDSKHYVVEKSEKEGLKDIRENIISKTLYEESWVYFPEKEKWYEVGINSVSDLEKGCSFVEMDSIGLDNVLKIEKDAKEIILYHNHPSVDPLGIPSRFDFTMMYHITNEINEKYPDMKVRCKICSKMGTTEFSWINQKILYWPRFDE